MARIVAVAFALGIALPGRAGADTLPASFALEFSHCRSAEVAGSRWSCRRGRAGRYVCHVETDGGDAGATVRTVDLRPAAGARGGGAIEMVAADDGRQPIRISIAGHSATAVVDGPPPPPSRPPLSPGCAGELAGRRADLAARRERRRRDTVARIPFHPGAVVTASSDAAPAPAVATGERKPATEMGADAGREPAPLDRSATAPSVDIGTPDADHPLPSPARVHQRVSARRTAFLACYRSALPRELGSGKVVLAAEVTAGGVVRSLGIATSTFADPPLHACLMRKARGLRVGAVDQATEIRIPILFSAGGE